MSREVPYNVLLDKLQEYKKKYYLNLLLKGSIFFLLAISVAFIFFTYIEYFVRLNSSLRLFLLISFVGITLYGLIAWIIIPLYKLSHLNDYLSDTEAAVQLGKYFPEIQDKLLNTIQLQNMPSGNQELIYASISQKIKELAFVPFIDAIKIDSNKKYLKYFSIPLAIVIVTLLVVPKLFLESSARIIQYNKEFPIPAPFKFVLSKDNYKAFKNEDFNIDLTLQGQALPDNVYLISQNGFKAKMKKNKKDSYSYSFKNIQKSEKFYFEASGFNSKTYKVDVIAKPGLLQMKTRLIYPQYLKRKPEELVNSGNLSIPEGTILAWDFKTNYTNKLIFRKGEEPFVTLENRDDKFSIQKTWKKSDQYQIILENEYGKSDELINYHVEVIPDAHPQVTLEQAVDSASYNRIFLGGLLSDDHGLVRAAILYRVTSNKKDSSFKMIPLSIEKNALSQQYYYNWDLSALNISSSDELEYYIQVWDNDGVNGSKTSRSSKYTFKLPNQKALEQEIETANKATQNNIKSSLSEIEKLQNDVKKAEDKLKSKNNLNWQDKKNIEEILKKHDELKKDLDKLKQQNEANKDKENLLSKPSPELQEKIEQLQKLMDELFDEQTKKLFEEMQKLLQENGNKEEIQKLLEEISKKDENLENELNRSLELIKELKFDQKLEQTIQKLEEKSQELKELSEKTQEKSDSQEKLSEKQEKINKDFEEVQKDLKNLQEMNKDLENKKDLKETSPEESQIKKDLEQGKQQLDKKQNKKASESQKDAGEKMKEMADKMSEMQAGSEMKEMQENIDDLRNVLENLLKLSFEQEALMKEFRTIHQSDPRFITLSQKQLKLKDDSKVIEDSLLALSKRVFQIKSFVTRELTSMKYNIDETMDALKTRRPEIAMGKQQFTMTSVNNLALMLNDALKQMQEQMAEAMKNNKPGGKQSCKKPGNNPKPGLGELQKQLNEKIQQLSQSGKSGKELSQELARLTAQQEMIRNALKELEKKMGKDGKDGKGKDGKGNGMNELSKKMEETESDLVNKNLNRQTLSRQQDILTRLLEAEKSVRERELDNKREAKSAEEKRQVVPPSIEKYLKEKENQVDFLKTISPALNPYYKQEVDEYFHKIEK